MLTPHHISKVSLAVILWTALCTAPAVRAQGGPPSGDRVERGGRGGPGGRGGSGGRGSNGPRFFERFTDEDRAAVREFLGAHFPEQITMFRRMEQGGSKGLRGQFGQIMPRILRLMEEYEHDEEGAELGIEELKLEFKIRKRVRLYQHETDAEQREALRDEIYELIARRFDVHQKRSRLQIARLELRMEDLKRRVSHRDDSRDAVVQQEVDAVLLPRDVFDRGGPGQRPDQGPGQRRGRRNRPGR